VELQPDKGLKTAIGGQFTQRFRRTTYEERKPAMNQEFKTTSKFVRSCIAVLATVSTVLVISGIAGLADHYNASGYVMAAHGTAQQG